MRLRTITSLTGAALLLALPAAAQSSDAMVSVVHGVPDLTVDVYVDGSQVLDDFTYQTVTDPVALAAGSHDIEIYPGDADPASSDPALATSVDLPAGANASLVAHLDADGNPTVTPFVNDTSNVAAGEARVAVRHTAAAPGVTVTANDSVEIVSGLTNANEAVTTVPADTYSVDVTLTDGGDAVFSDVQLPAEEGALTIVYAVGSGDAGYELLTDSITGLHSAPGGVPAGDAGLADTGAPLWLLVTGLGGVALVTSGLLRNRRPAAVTTRR